MEDCAIKLTDKYFQNWLKSMLALNITRDGIEDQVKTAIDKFHKDLLKEIFSPEQIQESDFCTCCSLENILPCQTKFMCSVRMGVCSFHSTEDKKFRPCPKHACDRFRDKIRKFHRNKFPSWKNTYPNRWFTDSWEIAKCCMPPSGYSKVLFPSETDLNGLLSVLMNHTIFESEVDETACNEARDYGNKVRHSPNLCFDDNDMKNILDSFIRCLSTSTCLANDVKAKQAVMKLRKLKTDSLPIAMDVLKDAIDDHTKNSVKILEETQLKLLEKVKEILGEDRNIQRLSLNEILGKISASLKADVENAFTASKREVERKASDTQEEYSKLSPEQQKYRKLKNDLKEDLLEHNWSQHQALSLSPLIEENDAPMTEFYVQPIFHCIDDQSSAFECQRTKSKKLVKCYRDIFFKYAKPCNEIYLTSEAGVGKTAFGKWLAVIWCIANGAGENEELIVSEGDMETIKSFHFVFIVSLRDFYRTECDVDKMIFKQIISQLSRSSLYTLEFLQDVLHHEKCLIILDGLDEWFHPEKCDTNYGTKQLNIPHRKPRKLCTVLTTTRPWKFETAGIKLSQIGQHVEMTGLDENGAEQLIKNVLSKLKGDCVLKATKSLKDFNSELDKNNIQDLKFTPIVLMHLICLWCDNHELGKSKCEIFANIVQLHILHAENKLGELFYPKLEDMQRERNIQKRRQNSPVSSVIYKTNEDLLPALGQLAFETLFKQNRECSLVFDSSVAISHLQGNLFDMALTTGLLTQRTVKTLTKKLSNVFFPHKTYQEYFAALYIQSLGSNYSEALRNVKEVCRSTESILEMSNVFVFMAGLCPETLREFSNELTKLVAEDEATQFYRSSSCSANYWNNLTVIRNLQDMVVACMYESSRNYEQEKKGVALNLEDFFLDGSCKIESYGSNVEALLKRNQQSLKSIHVSEVESPEKFSVIIDQYGLENLQSLEKLDLWVPIETKDLDRLFSATAHNLKHLLLHLGHFQKNRFVEYYSPISDVSLRAIQTMAYLETLSIWDLVFTHEQLENFMQALSKKASLKHIGIGDIKCNDQSDECSGHILDLSLHNELKVLQINLAPFAGVKVSVSSLQECHFGEFKSSVVLGSLCSCLQESETLSTFGAFGLQSKSDIETLVETLPLLNTLRHLFLNRVDLGDKELKLYPEVKSVEFVKLKRVSVSSRAMKNFFEEIKGYRHSVRVELVGCDIKPVNDFVLLKENINSSSSYFVIEDSVDQWKRSVFKVRTVEK